MKETRRIDTDSDLADFVKALHSKNTQTLAMDFEAEFSLHEYGERLCLIQVYDKERFYLLDPLRIGREALKEFLGDRKILKLFFGAGSDVQLIFKQFDVHMDSVLDLQILAQVLEYEKLGLDSLLQECLNISANDEKKHNQMTNWTVRPISDSAVNYALKDVEHLFSLYDFFVERIEREKRLEKTLRQLVLRTPSPLSVGIPSVFRSREFRDLGPAEKKHFEEVINVREQLAVELNWAPDNIFAKGQIARYVSGKLGLNDIPKPKRMTPEQYSRMKALIGNLRKIP